MAALARWCFRRKWLVIVLWLVALLGVGAAGNMLGSSYANVFSLPGTESTKVLDLMDKALPQQAGEADSVVWHVDSGSVRDPAVRARLAPVLEKIGKQPDVGTVVSPYDPAGAAQISKNGRTAYASITWTKIGNELTKDQMHDLVDTAHTAATDGLHVEVGGQAVALAEEPPAGLSEFVGIAAAAVVLFLAFGSLYGMLLPIVTALFGIGISSAAIIILSHLMNVADFSGQLSMLVGLGVGIDYALFIVTRHRRGILRGRTPEEAAITAVNTSGRAVLFAGGTVCIALLGMFTLQLSFLYGVAVSAAVTVVITVLAALTLLPAMLGVLGMKVLSRRQRRKFAATGPQLTAPRSASVRWSSFLERHPRSLALAAVTVMAVLAIPALSLRLGSSDQGNNPSDTTTRKAYDMIADGFGPGFNGPLTILAETPAGASDQAALGKLVTSLKSTPGIAYVATVPTKPGSGLTLVEAIPTTSPQDKATTTLIDHLRDDVVPAAEKGSTMQAYVGGQTAIFKDFASVLFGKLPLFIGVIIALGFVLLLIAFRSIVVPLTAAVMNLVAAVSSFGVLVACFQWGWGGAALGATRDGPIDAFLPVIMLSLLFGLSMDYQVFLVSRMHEEWVHTKDSARAVRVGLAETSRVINSAAVIMICVFGAFALSGVRVLAMFGVGLAGAVALDAFILRTVLVPSLMHIFGEANWWLPAWLDKRLPHLAVEPAEDDAPAGPPEGGADAGSSAGSSAGASAGSDGGSAAGSGAGSGASGPPAADTGGGPAVRGTVSGAGGLPVPRSELTLIAADGREVGRGAADEDGTFLLPTPGAGSYVLVANADGHHPQTASVMTADRPVDCDLRLAGTGSVSGRARRADGQPVEDARVSLQDADGHEVGTVQTAKDGSYAFGNLYPGRYTLLTSGYPPFPVTVRIAEGDEDGGGDVDLELSYSQD